METTGSLVGNLNSIAASKDGTKIVAVQNGGYIFTSTDSARYRFAWRCFLNVMVQGLIDV